MDNREKTDEVSIWLTVPTACHVTHGGSTPSFRLRILNNPAPQALRVLRVDSR